jgi:hypothetical protein
MNPEFDTFLVALYTHVDDLYRAHLAPQKPPRRGQPPTMSDSEVLTLLLLGQWSGRSEAALVAHAATAWRAYFPRLLERSAFNRRARDLAGALVALIPRVAEALGLAEAAYQVIDGVPVPLMRRCRGERHRCFGEEAGIGRGGSDHDWYYGCELLVAASDQGAITGFVLGPPATDDRWFAETLLCTRQDPTAIPWGAADLPPSHRKGGGRTGPTGPLGPRGAAGVPSAVPYLADCGFAGAVWQVHWQTDYGATVLTPRDLAATRDHPARRQFAGWRQVIETINSQLEQVLHLWYPGAHTAWGLLTRIAAKLLAFNLGLLLNRHFDRATFALTTLVRA